MRGESERRRFKKETFSTDVFVFPFFISFKSNNTEDTMGPKGETAHRAEKNQKYFKLYWQEKRFKFFSLARRARPSGWENLCFISFEYFNTLLWINLLRPIHPSKPFLFALQWNQGHHHYLLIAPWRGPLDITPIPNQCQNIVLNRKCRRILIHDPNVTHAGGFPDEILSSLRLWLLFKNIPLNNA